MNKPAHLREGQERKAPPVRRGREAHVASLRRQARRFVAGGGQPPTAPAGGPVLQHQRVHLFDGVHQLVVRVVGGQLELQDEAVDLVDHQRERQLFVHRHFNHFGGAQHHSFERVNYLFEETKCVPGMKMRME